MDRIHQNKHIGGEARDDDPIFCSSCAAQPSQFISVLDSRNGKQHRVFKCECGEIVWDDRTAYLIGIGSSQ
jgi:hypothetical protein